MQLIPKVVFNPKPDRFVHYCPFDNSMTNKVQKSVLGIRKLGYMNLNADDSTELYVMSPS